MTQEKKVALITGVTGQDGAYLSELLDKGCEVRLKRSSRVAVSLERSKYTAKANAIDTSRTFEAWHADSGPVTTASTPRARFTTPRHTAGAHN